MKRRFIVLYVVLFSLLSCFICTYILHSGSKQVMPQYKTEINRLIIDTGEIYLESLIEDRVADDKPIASSLAELINKLYFLK